MMSGLTRIPDSRQTSRRVRKVPKHKSGHAPLTLVCWGIGGSEVFWNNNPGFQLGVIYDA
jgi:hypothetical protein